MRILVQIHTWNDADVIDPALDAVLCQTFPVREILLVDNASTDQTVHREFPETVTVVRHERNLGTSGSVKTALRYAMDHAYDWVWVLDADSRPEPDALEKLVRLYDSYPEDARVEIGILSSSHDLRELGERFYGRILTPGGPRLPRIDNTRAQVECDTVIWSGSLIRVDAARGIGMPRSPGNGWWEDLALDYGDVEFSFRMRQAGYRVVTHRFSMIDHPVGRGVKGRILGHVLHTTNHSPSRRYLYFRNLVYFWLFLYPHRNWPTFGLWLTYRTARIVTGILLLERDRRTKLRACARGFRDGLSGELSRPFENGPAGDQPS